MGGGLQPQPTCDIPTMRAPGSSPQGGPAADCVGGSLSWEELMTGLDDLPLMWGLERCSRLFHSSVLPLSACAGIHTAALDDIVM